MKRASTFFVIALLVSALTVTVFAHGPGRDRGNYMMGYQGSGRGYDWQNDPGYGDLTEDQITLAQNLFSRYSQAKGKKKIQVVINEKIVDVEEVNLEKLAEDIKKYLVL